MVAFFSALTSWKFHSAIGWDAAFASGASLGCCGDCVVGDVHFTIWAVSGIGEGVFSSGRLGFGFRCSVGL